jgi:FkbM family methyltransferase
MESKAVTVQDDLPFRHYSLKHRVIAWISQSLFDNVTYTVRHGLLKGMKRKGGLGFVPEFLAHDMNESEIRFWINLDLSAKVIYDVGAFHGLLTLFFARRARQVICYEPNSKNRARLLENIRLNELDNVQVRPVGAGSVPQELILVWDPLMPGGASTEVVAAERMRKSVARARSETIHITTLDQDILETSLPAPDFIKIDVEGLELDVLLGARETLARHCPDLFLEMHGETLNEKRRKVRALVEFLADAGYQSIRHVETDTLLNRGNAEIAVEGHLYCLGKPRDNNSKPAEVGRPQNRQ